MTELKIKLVFGCLNCDEPIPLSIARKGKQICSKKCMKELNKKGGYWDLNDVWDKRWDKENIWKENLLTPNQ